MDAAKFQVVSDEQKKLPPDPHDLRLTLRGAVCYRDGRLLLDAYNDLRYRFRTEPPVELHPDPSRPGMQLWEDTTQILGDLELWNDGHCCVSNRHGDLKHGNGWIVHHPVEVTPSGDRASKRFSTQTWGSWRLTFLLAKLQRDVWWDRYGQPTSMTMKVESGNAPCKPGTFKRGEDEVPAQVSSAIPNCISWYRTCKSQPESQPILPLRSKVEEKDDVDDCHTLDEAVSSFCDNPVLPQISQTAKLGNVDSVSQSSTATRPCLYTASLVHHAEKGTPRKQTKFESTWSPNVSPASDSKRNLGSQVGLLPCKEMKAENHVPPGPVTRALWAIAQSSPGKAIKLEANPLLASIFGSIKNEREEHLDIDVAEERCSNETPTVTPRKSIKFNQDGKVGELSPPPPTSVAHGAKRRRIVGKREICRLLMCPDGTCHTGWAVKHEEIKTQCDPLSLKDCKIEAKEERERGLFAFIKAARALAFVLE